MSKAKQSEGTLSLILSFLIPGAASALLLFSLRIMLKDSSVGTASILIGIALWLLGVLWGALLGGYRTDQVDEVLVVEETK